MTQFLIVFRGLAVALIFASLFLNSDQYAQKNSSYSFADEFTGRPRQTFDPSKWTAEIGGGGWGNEELQYYMISRALISMAMAI